MGPDDPDLATVLRNSLQSQTAEIRASIVLNPVENFPFPEDLAVLSGPLHGLYNSDKVRTRDQRVATDMQFGGRDVLASDARAMYRAWAAALGAADVTMRVLSGLHAHVTLFMAMTRPGESVALLPVEAGGHVSAKVILERLGLVVSELPVDREGMCVDMTAATLLCKELRPDYVLVDRSEGLVYEDFTPLAGLAAKRSVFDASQYLSNVLSGDHANPFGWGFDMMIASVHKNFPGPQKALLATRTDDDEWQRILAGVGVYVSNMHSTSTYAAALTLSRVDWLAAYSREMLAVAVRLEAELADRDVPVVRRPTDRPPTHHVWIAEGERTRAFETFERLEAGGILTNFRRLPYGLGHGLRLGVTAAVRLGLRADQVPRLADLIAEIRRVGATPRLRAEVRSFAHTLWEQA